MDMGPEEIDRLVFERFPKLATERNCAMEKRMRDAARASYRLKLLHEFSTAKEILDAGRAADEAV